MHAAFARSPRSPLRCVAAAAAALASLAAVALLASVGAAQVGVLDGGPSAGRVVWLRADRGVAHGFTNLVQGWADASGNGHGVTGSGDGESQPEWLAVGIGGKPALRFDGNDWLAGSGVPTGSYTKAVVAQLDDLAGVNNVVSSQAHHALWFGGSPYARLYHSGDVVQSSVAVTAGVPFVLVASYEAVTGRASLYLDGQLVGRTTGAAGNWDPSLQLGAFAWGNFLRGRIAEVSIWDHELGVGELAQLHADLQRRYFDRALPAVEFAALPRPGQLLQRDDQYTAALDLRGQVTSPGFDTITLEIARDGAPWLARTHRLQYGANGHAGFLFDPTLYAGLHDHDLALFVEGGGRRHLVAAVPAVTVGDLYVIHGQSNAQASDYWGEGLANGSQSRWVRSFGSSSIGGGSDFDFHWDVADGQGYFGHADVGQWALRMGEFLVHHEQLPIALINGAVGGTSVWQHQRNDVVHQDSSTIYGRLLRRMEEAGAAEKFRALLWYQGESDAWSANSWYQGWINLRADWAKDFPALERVYVVQIRNDCGSGGAQLKELQRLLPDLWSDTTVMASNGVPAHDGCHYQYVGYRDLGEKLARLVRRDFHGALDTREIDPPNPASARFLDAAHTQVAITFRDANDALRLDAGAERDFEAGDRQRAIAGSVAGNVVTLTFAAPLRVDAISYRGHPFDGPWLATARGVGALAFEALPIR